MVAWDALAGFLVDFSTYILYNADIFYYDAKMGHGLHVA
jgi:hypothetical protein